MSSETEGGYAIPKSRDNLIIKWVYFAEVSGFTFQFANMNQVLECKSYFEQKTHPSTIQENHNGLEHYWHPWYCKLPKGMVKNKNRLKVLKAMDKIIKEWGSSHNKALNKDATDVAPIS